jgi:hypothetical protein
VGGDGEKRSLKKAWRRIGEARLYFLERGERKEISDGVEQIQTN